MWRQLSLTVARRSHASASTVVHGAPARFPRIQRRIEWHRARHMDRRHEQSLISVTARITCAFNRWLRTVPLTPSNQISCTGRGVQKAIPELRALCQTYSASGVLWPSATDSSQRHDWHNLVAATATINQAMTTVRSEQRAGRT